VFDEWLEPDLGGGPEALQPVPDLPEEASPLPAERPRRREHQAHLAEPADLPIDDRQH
jgi:hypothetical protein